MNAYADEKNKHVDGMWSSIRRDWHGANFWDKVGMLAIGLLSLTMMVVIIASIIDHGMTALERRSAQREYLVYLRSGAAQQIEIPTYGVEHTTLFRVEEVPLGGPVRGTLVVLLPTGATNMRVEPALSAETQSGTFGLTDFELALSTCSFAVKYDIQGETRSRIWGSCPTLKEGIEIAVREVAVRPGEEEVVEPPPQYGAQYLTQRDLARWMIDALFEFAAENPEP